MSLNNDGSAVKQMDQFRGLMGKAYYMMDKLDEKAIALAVYERVRGKAVYRIIFKTRKGPVEISGLSVDGAEELYRLCRFRGLVPLLEVKDIRDTQANGHFITTIIWRVMEPTVPPTMWELITRGSATLGEDLFERKALGKAQRNAQLKVIPVVVREAMKAVLGQKLGVKEMVWDEDEAAPVENGGDTPSQPQANGRHPASGIRTSDKAGNSASPAQTGGHPQEGVASANGKAVNSASPAQTETQPSTTTSPNPQQNAGDKADGQATQDSQETCPSAPSDTTATPPPPPTKRSLTRVVQINGRRIRTAGIEAEQLQALWRIAGEDGIEPVAGLLKAYGVEKSTYLTKEEASRMLERLKGTSPEVKTSEEPARLSA